MFWRHINTDYRFSIIQYDAFIFSGSVWESKNSISHIYFFRFWVLILYFCVDTALIFWALLRPFSILLTHATLYHILKLQFFWYNNKKYKGILSCLLSSVENRSSAEISFICNALLFAKWQHILRETFICFCQQCWFPHIWLP